MLRILFTVIFVSTEYNFATVPNSNIQINKFNSSSEKNEENYMQEYKNYLVNTLVAASDDLKVITNFENKFKPASKHYLNQINKFLSDNSDSDRRKLKEPTDTKESKILYPTKPNIILEE